MLTVYVLCNWMRQLVRRFMVLLYLNKWHFRIVNTKKKNNEKEFFFQSSKSVMTFFKIWPKFLIQIDRKNVQIHSNHRPRSKKHLQHRKSDTSSKNESNTRRYQRGASLSLFIGSDAFILLHTSIFCSSICLFGRFISGPIYIYYLFRRKVERERAPGRQGRASKKRDRGI